MSPNNYEDPILTSTQKLDLKEKIMRIDYIFLISGLFCALFAYVLGKPYSNILAQVAVVCVCISLVCFSYRYIRWNE